MVEARFDYALLDSISNANPEFRSKQIQMILQKFDLKKNFWHGRNVVQIFSSFEFSIVVVQTILKHWSFLCSVRRWEKPSTAMMVFWKNTISVMMMNFEYRGLQWNYHHMCYSFLAQISCTSRGKDIALEIFKVLLKYGI